jgi:hypothetical protein
MRVLHDRGKKTFARKTQFRHFLFIEPHRQIHSYPIMNVFWSILQAYLKIGLVEELGGRVVSAQVSIVRRGLSQHGEKHVVPTLLSGIRVGKRKKKDLKIGYKTE